jgi:proteic killer suppression protein
MDIEYADSKMEKDFESRRRLEKKYGSLLPGLANRLSELRAANCLADIPHEPPPKRHKLSDNWDGCWGIKVTKNYRLVIRPIGDFDINDQTTITKMKIEAIIDYH